MNVVVDMRMTTVVLWSFVLLQLCSGGDMKCSVTHDTDRTIYKIMDVNLKATGCLYSWTDADNYVIANHLNHTRLVTTNQDGTLVTKKCMENIIFIRNCISEGIEYMANCTVDCGENAPFLGDKDTPVPWIVVAVVLLVVLLMGGLYFWYRKSKGKGNACQVGGFYTGVKSYEMKEVVVEEKGDK